MTYHILVSDTSGGLTLLVNDALSKGWTLHGGVSVAHCYIPTEHLPGGQVSHSTIELTFAQAITRPHEAATQEAKMMECC